MRICLHDRVLCANAGKFFDEGSEYESLVVITVVQKLAGMRTDWENAYWHLIRKDPRQALDQKGRPCVEPKTSRCRSWYSTSVGKGLACPLSSLDLSLGCESLARSDRFQCLRCRHRRASRYGRRTPDLYSRIQPRTNKAPQIREEKQRGSTCPVDHNASETRPDNK